MPTFPAPDGTELFYDAYEPAAPRAQLLLLHGWSDHAGRYRWLAEQLRAAGLAAYTPDLRGHGRSGGRRAHLARFSQLLGDVHAFRRVAQRKAELPQVLVGHGFGALVALRYLETQPILPPIAAVLSAPLLGAARTAWWHNLATRVLGDLWPSFSLSTATDPSQLSRDPEAVATYAADQGVAARITVGARREIEWAQRAVVADGRRIEAPLLFLLGGEDRVTDPHLARAFADGLACRAAVRWYPEMYHDVFSDPQKATVVADVVAFVDTVLAEPSAAQTRTS